MARLAPSLHASVCTRTLQPQLRAVRMPAALAQRRRRCVLPPRAVDVPSQPRASSQPPPRSSSALGDVLAGISVACVAVPQSLAYASLAGLSATQGLHVTAVAPFPAAALTTSRYVQTGAVAMTSLLTAGALASAGLAAGAPERAGAAALLAGVVGLTRLVLGAMNGGALLPLLPPTVLEGFALAAVWLVFLTQLPVVLGVAPPAGLHFLPAAAWMLARPAAWQLGCIATAAVTTVCLVGGKRLHPLFPGAILACALGCAAAAAGFPVGATVGAVRAGLPQLVAPAALPWHLLPALLPSGVAIALAGFAEAAAVGSRFAAEDREAWSCNRELLSQGAANLGVAAFGGFPVGGSLSRTSLGRTAGARSQLAHVVTGVAVLVFLPVGAAALSALPRAVLGALVAVAMAPLMFPTPAMRLPLRHGAGAFAIGWFTTLVTLLASPRLELGLQAGLALALALSAVHAGKRSWAAQQQFVGDASGHPPAAAAA